MKEKRKTIRAMLELLEMECVVEIKMDNVTFNTFTNFVIAHGIEDRYEYYFKGGLAIVSKAKPKVEDQREVEAND